ncbi:N-acetylmuramoyl-L-alanine amidase [Hoyosella rhizosphaerae]|uniref:Cold-shock protein n=1 Tax=Hoyosella rhizosphaerae TaxID=1755582 RepID=A0A916XEL5_9ACTN|nr:N-acetylmuramoyl-L-alanine amidase [Hoyosella rhizosphaerae]MBN4927397.1 N-acetylmuramoyl-L-alanine amidase [Hoyosella rhizosphaerae]GGC64737.1 hypothetical protein GCM10011410_16620 [Hoyosella rhizosphaerae]
MPKHHPRRFLTLSVAVGVAAAGSLIGLNATSTDIAYATDESEYAPTSIDEVALALDSTAVPTDIANPPRNIQSDDEPIVREVSQEMPFNMFGLTWDGEGDPQAYVRAKLDEDTWSEWFDLEPIDSDSDIADTSRQASDVVFVGDTTTVQISIGGKVSPVLSGDTDPEKPLAPEEAAPVGEPSDISRPLIYQPPAPERNGTAENLTAIIVRPSKAPILDEPSDISGEVSDIAGVPAKPNVVTRAQWGANENIRCRQPRENGGLGAVVVHHTAGNNNYTQDQSAQIVRGIYAYHAQTLGWCDVGYHGLVDKFGTIFEGRFGGMERDLQGAHTGGFNINTAGYAMLGHYNNVTPPRAQLESIAKLAGWRLALEDLSPTGSSTHYSEGTSFTWIPQGQPIRLTNIFAHRDVGYTDCPGHLGYQQMNLIRSMAAEYQASAGTGGGSDNDDTTDPAPTDPTPTDPAPTNPAPTNPAPSEPAPRTSWSSSELQGLGAQLPRLLGALRNNAVAAADEVDEAVAQRWYTLGGTEGVLGNIVEPIQTINDAVRFARFDNGTIYWSPSTGARGIWGAIGEEWLTMGAENGPLGMPVNEEYSVPEGIRADFQNGYILFDTATGGLSVEIQDAPIVVG